MPLSSPPPFFDTAALARSIGARRAGDEPVNDSANEDAAHVRNGLRTWGASVYGSLDGFCMAVREQAAGATGHLYSIGTVRNQLCGPLGRGHILEAAEDLFMTVGVQRGDAAGDRLNKTARTACQRSGPHLSR